MNISVCITPHRKETLFSYLLRLTGFFVLGSPHVDDNSGSQNHFSHGLTPFPKETLFNHLLRVRQVLASETWHMADRSDSHNYSSSHQMSSEPSQ
jgi:hypothetical protein